jgi:mannose-6-phosphate isomerase-like protein (cupin superfamily)
MAELAGAAFSVPGRERIIYPFSIKHVIHATAAETNGAIGIFEAYQPPGEGPGWHIHTREVETFYVVEGMFSIWVGDEMVEGGPGTTVVAPKNVPHRWKNSGSDAGRLMMMVTPAGFESFFYDVVALPELTGEALSELAIRYGGNWSPEQAVGTSTE